MLKTDFEYFVWIDADTLFRHHPANLLSLLSAAPVHAPLWPLGSVANEQFLWGTIKKSDFVDNLRTSSVLANPHVASSAFWIIHRDAVEAVFNFSFGLWHQKKAERCRLNFDACLGVAVQAFCGNPSVHAYEAGTEIWTTSELRAFYPQTRADLPRFAENQGKLASSIIHGFKPA
jgi:hypothetical protein